MNINIEELASYLADEELDDKMQNGIIKYNDVWMERKEECHGIHKFYDLTDKGQEEWNYLHNKYLSLIQEFEE